MKQSFRNIWLKAKGINKPVLIAGVVLLVVVVAIFSYSPLRNTVANLVGLQNEDENTTSGNGVSITPNSGPLSGGTAVTITGEDFNATTKIYFDLDGNGQKDEGEECRYLKHLSSTQIDCITPPGQTVGAKDMRITSRTIPNIMQATDQEFCQAMAIRKDDNPGAVVEIEDVRNGQTYPVARLADGKCWMLGSLKIDNYRATKYDTDLNEGVEAESGFLIPKVKAEATNETYPKTYFSLAGGNLYNFVAVTARNSMSTSGSSIVSISPNSICPLNWRLPSVGEMTSLRTAMTNLQPEKNYQDNFKLNGGLFLPGTTAYTSNGTSVSSSLYNYYWANGFRHSNSGRQGNILPINRVDGSNVESETPRSNGAAVRCILR